MERAQQPLQRAEGEPEGAEEGGGEKERKELPSSLSVGWNEFLCYSAGLWSPSNRSGEQSRRATEKVKEGERKREGERREGCLSLAPDMF